MKKLTLVIIHKEYSSAKAVELERKYGGENIEGKSFSRIYHLIPFYDKDRDPNPQNKDFNIIPVYDNYNYHQSFIATGLPQYYSENTSHYIFVNADLELDAAVNENNYQDFFGIDDDTAYIEEIADLDNAYSLLPWKYNPFYHLQQAEKNEAAGSKDNKNAATKFDYLQASLTTSGDKQWPLSIGAYNFSLQMNGVQWPAQLTNHIEAMQKFKNNGLSIDHIDIKKAVRRHKKGIYAKHSAIKKSMMLRAIIERWVRGNDSYRPYKLAYPLARGKTDIVIIPHHTINNFATHCGIFAAYKLPYEIAITTAAVLTATHLTQAIK